MKVTHTLLALSGVLLIGAATTLRAAVVTLVGSDTTTGADWRTTTTVKPFVTAGNNIYGTAGYSAFGPGTVGNTSGTGTGSVDFVASGLTSQPNFGTLAVTASGAGTQFQFSNFGYASIDNPTLAPGPSVADIQSGLGGFAGVAPAAGMLASNIVDLTIGIGVPSSFRFGVIISGASGSGLTLLSLTQSAGTGGGFASGAPAPGGGVNYTFFDVSGATTGDKFTLGFSKINDGSGVVAVSGVTFDAVPEPSSVLLLGAGTIALLLRRRAAAPRG